jgi:hypothetical protein
VDQWPFVLEVGLSDTPERGSSGEGSRPSKIGSDQAHHPEGLDDVRAYGVRRRVLPFDPLCPGCRLRAATRSSCSVNVPTGHPGSGQVQVHDTAGHPRHPVQPEGESRNLDRVTAWLMVNGFINAEPRYSHTTAVMNLLSDLIPEL